MLTEITSYIELRTTLSCQ